MRLSILALLAIVTLVSCDNEDNDRAETNSYLPLAVGNYWEFKSAHVGAPETILEHREVTAIKTMNGKDFFQIVSTSGSEPNIYKDTIYYRIGSHGYVYELRRGANKEENRMRLNASDGDTWSYDIEGYETDIKLTQVVLNVNGTDLAACKAFSKDVIRMADEERTTTLAPNIGFVKEFSDGWGNGAIIKKARINGEVMDF